MPVGTALDAPVHCVFVSLALDGDLVTYPRTLIVAGEGSCVTVVEQYLGQGAYWTNAVTEAIVGAGATVVHHTLQREAEQAAHLGVVAVAQAGVCTFRSHVVSLGAGLARSDI